MTNYEITDLNQLIEQANLLGTNGQKVSNCANELKRIIEQINANWQPSEQGQDLPGALQKLTEVVNNLQNAIVPTISQYRDAMNTLAVETSNIQNKTV